MIPVTRDIQLRESEITERFVRSRGPGGQNVNKTATTVQLRYDLDASDLPEEVKERVRLLAAGRLDKQGRIVIRARRFRSLEQNRREARQRLVKLVRRATERRKPRVLRRGENRRARAARVAEKRRRGERKRLRAAPPLDE